MGFLHHATVGLVEYRRHPFDPGALHLECRFVRPDGTAYDEGWYRVSDDALANLQRDGAGRDMIRRLWAEPDRARPAADVGA